jgi:hypothetical protein
MLDPETEAHARRVGRAIGRWAWNTTATTLRACFVVPINALIFHAIEPGMPFGAWCVIFAATYIIAWPSQVLYRTVRRMLRKASLRLRALRQGSGFAGQSRVLPRL